MLRQKGVTERLSEARQLLDLPSRASALLLDIVQPCSRTVRPKHYSNLPKVAQLAKKPRKHSGAGLGSDTCTSQGTLK